MWYLGQFKYAKFHDDDDTHFFLFYTENPILGKFGPKK